MTSCLTWEIHLFQIALKTLLNEHFNFGQLLLSTLEQWWGISPKGPECKIHRDHCFFCCCFFNLIHILFVLFFVLFLSFFFL